MAYTLTLTSREIQDIRFCGDRYDWSAAFARLCDEGTNEISEVDAWSLKEAAESDCEGGHSIFPMLSSQSELFQKLLLFVDGIV